MQSGENVLLLGTGGVSVFGLQIAKAAGANTVMTSSSDTKLAQAQKLGATHTVNYRTNPEWDVAVKKATGVGVHHVLEIGGAGTLQKSLASLANGGHIAVIGGLSSNYGDLSTMALLGKNASITGITVGSRAEFEALLKFMTEHRIKPVIDRHFEYFNAEAAYEYMDSGSHFSKIVIRM
jgi:NADPH:quinone reductase-like Zn-dependent oxidoreductase